MLGLAENPTLYAVIPRSSNIAHPAGRFTGMTRVSGGPLARRSPVRVSMTTNAVYLDETPYVVASDVMQAAQALAKQENKRVFLHFGAPWCGWCHRLEDWMRRPEIAAILSKEFVDCKIDTDRMTGGQAMLDGYRKDAGLTEGGGIPWFVFRDADGKVLAHSEGPKGNTGFPYQPEEVAHFATMLKAARLHLTDADIEAMQASLNAIRAADTK